MGKMGKMGKMEEMKTTWDEARDSKALCFVTP